MIFFQVAQWQRKPEGHVCNIPSRNGWFMMRTGVPLWLRKPPYGGRILDGKMAGFAITVPSICQLLEGMAECQQLWIPHEKEHGWPLQLGDLQCSSETEHSITGSTHVSYHFFRVSILHEMPEAKNMYSGWSHWRSKDSSLEKSALSKSFIESTRTTMVFVAYRKVS